LTVDSSYRIIIQRIYRILWIFIVSLYGVAIVEDTVTIVGYGCHIISNFIVGDGQVNVLTGCASRHLSKRINIVKKRLYSLHLTVGVEGSEDISIIKDTSLKTTEYILRIISLELFEFSAVIETVRKVCASLLTDTATWHKNESECNDA
jgi:hypothetical protein